MAHIDVQNLSIQFPIYGTDARSLKKMAVSIAIGGRLGLRRSTGATVVAALSSVSLRLKPGDRLGLVGPNGSGKTTLLRALAGVYSPDAGVIEVDGKVAALLDLSLGIDPSATGLDNIRLRCLIAGLTRKQTDERIDAIAEFSGLGPYLALPLKTYSSGMQARLAFSAATSVDADILLLDEWVAVGDAEFVHKAQQRLLGMMERSEIMVLATHNTALMGQLCNKFMRFDHGAVSPIQPIERLNDPVT